MTNCAGWYSEASWGEDRDLTEGMTRALCGSSGGEIQPTKLGLGGGPRQYADPTGRKREPPVRESGPRGAMQVAWRETVVQDGIGQALHWHPNACCGRGRGP